ncbi:ABC transporter substrate-binding protein [Parathalassolituus penaei]|uniref:Sugar ABC transporter substrate-binding protein n=1 Tax=Parathalassolituus penaei TaxID=2997323 RepID=A0A9X3ITD0_9GAMM|nr:sugar ABC transporter substrate-binding protein [Parathalassolituus penaei]MCY0965063.1 sugar ABC transporter substrate-binding protein [Parathalassolituus penaei]
MIRQNKALLQVLMGILLCWVLAGPVAAQNKTELVIATVNNGHMLAMEQLSHFFEEANPDIHLRWVTLEEGVLRQRVTTDIATRAGQFDVLTIGMYEAPMWGERGWLLPLEFDDDYRPNDLLPTIKAGLSARGKLVAAPFYGESSMLFYRKDLLAAVGKTMPANPTWQQVEEMAAAIHDPAKGVYGVCLRGKPGWGDNMALLGTMVNTFGGRWFDINWQPQINTDAWKSAVSFYISLLQNYGPENASANSFNENLDLFSAGKCGMWVDATVAASFVSDPAMSTVAGKVGFAPAPVAVTPRGANWLWAWALAIPSSSRQQDAAKRFVRWATSRSYIELVGRELGWHRVPTGTRLSTYQIPAVRAAMPFLDAEREAIDRADPKQSTLQAVPYIGIQVVNIPEFQRIGLETGRQISAALAGKRSVEDALRSAQQFAEQEMKRNRGKP